SATPSMRACAPTPAPRAWEGNRGTALSPGGRLRACVCAVGRPQPGDHHPGDYIKRHKDCPGGPQTLSQTESVSPRGAGLRKGRCTTSWLFCWLLHSGSIFEKLYLPVGTAGFEPATP